MRLSINLSQSEIEDRVNLLRSIDSDTAERFVASEQYEWLPLYVALRQSFEATPTRLRNIMHKFTFEGYDRLHDGTIYHVFRNRVTRRVVRLIVAEDDRPLVIGVTKPFDVLRRGDAETAKSDLFLSIHPDDRAAYFLGLVRA
jgi:hypothetical protein